VDRFIASLRLMVQSWFDERLFGFYPYVITSFDVARQTLNATPFNNPKLPLVQGVSIRSPGLQFKCAPNEQCTIAFEGGDPTRPFVATLGLASEYQGALPVVRQGDMVRSGGAGTLVAFYPMATPPIPPLVTLGVPYLVSFGNALSVPPRLPVPPPLQSPLYGMSSTGSTRTKAT
jgi:hypothetical protein